jgi:enoyl-CoA hydratase/carnithine racemase
MTAATTDSAAFASLGTAGLVSVEARGATLVVTLTRPAKRNALNDPTVLALEKVFTGIPDTVRAVVLAGDGDHFCAGLDLSELTERDVPQGIRHSMMWHRIFERIQFGPVPVIAVLKGAVIGGGLELALATHIRVAEESAYYALPEGQRGIYTGGGASVRLPRIIGIDRMIDMMLTGRSYSAADGVSLGLSQYLTPPGQGLERALALAEKIAGNAAITNFALIQVLPRIAEQDRSAGYLSEALMAGIAQGEPDAKARVRAFLDGKTAKVTHSS